MLRTKSTKELTAYEKKLREYYWKCFISEFSKVLIFLIIFMSLQLTNEYFVALLFLMILRNNGGGLHFNHYISCLVVSFFFLCSSIFLAMGLHPTRTTLCICTILGGLIGHHLVPITSNNRPPATTTQITKSKRNTTIVIFIIIILILTCPLNTYLYIGFWTVVLHIVQLLVAYFIKEVKTNA